MQLSVGCLLGFALAATLGCASIDFTGKEYALEEAQRRYTELVRWGEIEGASAYVDPAIASEFLVTAERFQDIRITDLESGPLKFGEGANTATVDVVYHAYSIRMLVEQKFREHQVWYREVSAGNEWRVRPNLAAIASELSGSQ